MKNRSEIERLSAPGVWEKVLDLLGDCSHLKVLDAPAGAGYLSCEMRKKGAAVVSVDINPRTYNENTNWVQADLNKPLPFAKESFDRVVSVEGIEHIESPFWLLDEFSRLLKDGGFIIVTTPNTVSLRSRLKFFLTGNLFWFGESAIDRFGHIMPIMPPIIRYAAKKAGFKRVDININRGLPVQRLFSWVYRLFSWCFREHENDAQLLAGEIVILKLSK